MPETIYFGAGCFWCTEAIFQSLRGVISVTSGYAGGLVKNPTYDQVSTGQTGHAEVVKIDYDPQILSFPDLLEVFFTLHDPTTKDRQGADIGTQYRSLILYTTEYQKEESEKAKIQIPEAVTEIKSFSEFFEAENYHQKYYSENPGQPYCQLVISPKLTKLKQKYSKLLNIEH